MLVKCEFCGKEFHRCEAHIKRAKHNFCSKECHFKSKLNKFEVIENVVKIYAKNKEKQYEIIVDKDIFIKKIQNLGVVICITKETKYKKPYPYYQDKKTRKKIKLHRFIMDSKEGEVIDHINGNIFDNRLKNLRKVDTVINLQNAKAQKNSSSSVKGVYYSKKRHKWNGLVQVNGKRKNLGYYVDFKECCKAVEEYRNEQLSKYLNSYYGKLS